MSMTPPDLRSDIRRAAGRSEFLRALASVRRDGGTGLALGNTPLRPPSPAEVAQLEKQGNTAEDWSRVRVAEGFDPARVRGSKFLGDVVIGALTGTVLVSGVKLPAGIQDSTVADCVIGAGALVRGVGLLANYVLEPGAVVFDCGRVTCEPPTTFGNGLVL